MVLTTATDVNQIVLDQLQAQFPSHIEQKIVQGTKSKTSRALLKEKMTIAINAGGKPVLTIPNISKIPRLAGAVPVGYIDYIKDAIGEDVSIQYAEYAEYFTDLVIEDKQEYIARKLKSAFDNPSKKRVFGIFLKKLNKYSNGKEIDQVKMAKLVDLMSKLGEKLDIKLSDLREASASQDEIIAKLKKNIENNKVKLQKLQKLEEELKGQEEELKGQEEELKGQRKKLREEIEKIKKQIKDWGGDIEKLQGRFS